MSMQPDQSCVNPGHTDKTNGTTIHFQNTNTRVIEKRRKGRIVMYNSAESESNYLHVEAKL